MNVTTGSSATTIFVGGPCGGCGHPQDVHDVVCADPECERGEMVLYAADINALGARARQLRAALSAQEEGRA